MTAAATTTPSRVGDFMLRNLYQLVRCRTLRERATRSRLDISVHMRGFSARARWSSRASDSARESIRPDLVQRRPYRWHGAPFLEAGPERLERRQRAQRVRVAATAGVR